MLSHADHHAMAVIVLERRSGIDGRHQVWYLINVMLGKISMSLVVATALFGGVARPALGPCILSNGASEEACQPGCCANMTCCATSKRTTTPVLPLATSNSDQQTIAILPCVSAVTVIHRPVMKLQFLVRADYAAHSPAPLARICIRLI
jgi:hypothetical protein